MKKTLLAAMMASVLVLTACGAQQTAAPAESKTADTAAEKEDTAEENAAAEDNTAEDTDKEENAEETASESKNAGEAASEDAAGSEADTYVFAYNGVEMSVNQEAAAVLDALGEPLSYFEAASCAFEGLDKMYTYSSFEVDTYPEGDTDYISCIYFLDDMVETPEGISLYMSKADMEEAYGTEYEEVSGAYVYSKGNGQLSFIIDNDEIVAIEYKTKVDYD